MKKIPGAGAGQKRTGSATLVSSLKIFTFLWEKIFPLISPDPPLASYLSAEKINISQFFSKVLTGAGSVYRLYEYIVNLKKFQVEKCKINAK